MPGQVIEEHAKFEEDCAKCHKRFDKSAQSRLCGDCHKDIRKDFEDKQRFHGRLTTQRECRACHTDHKGRKENIAPINESTFDHSRTNFSLTGAHADPRKADCKACHKPKVKYRDTPSDCYSCHQKDDKHKTNFGEKCAPCHTENNWREIIFDHDRDTKYRLSGKHRTAKCESCHAGHVYKDTLKTDCVSCHKKDDYHKGVFGPQCRTCHDEHNWKTSPFNHDKDTKYPLLGKHKTAKCGSCHTAPVSKEKTPTVCYACHKKDDKHGGALGRACEQCHTAHSWKHAPSFDHGKSRFPLYGAHLIATCAGCHIDQRYKPTPLDCYSCHTRNDRHRGIFGRECETCHLELDWSSSSFDHDRATRYPLSKRHRGITCERCHEIPVGKPLTSRNCAACHNKDDTHKGAYGEKCDTCHTAGGWKDIVFDHDRDTKYRLTGRHRTTSCASCHKGPLYTDKTPTDCRSCHGKDDAHKGTFGERCADCHAEQDWKVSFFDHGRQAKWPLLGKHAGQTCRQCHKGHLYQDKTPTDCVACHKKDDKHQGQQGTQCNTCHRETSWKEVSFNHDKSRFPLRGRHNLIECATCHKTLRFKDAPSDCNGCHEKDDIHKQRFSSQCETCHTARAWKVWDFDHNRRTSFPLDGAHQKLDCYECHSAPMPKKVVAPKTCIGCHRKDDTHEGGFGPRCEHCHSATLWKELKPGSLIRKK